MEEKQNCIQTPVNKGTAQFCYKKQKMESYIPLYYMSKKTNTAEEKRQHFKIVTDSFSISEDYAKKELITRIARWAFQLEEFDYEIEHRAGSRMKHVDALSRYPVMMPSKELQFELDWETKTKVLGPCKVTKVNSYDRYEVERLVSTDGPEPNHHLADLMKHFYA
ncbi:RT_RNaseH domain-containing protein [Trichonephila clavipes]|nr:RT_RNaseH domain-containing protein [Trichonephila clavipes]